MSTASIIWATRANFNLTCQPLKTDGNAFPGLVDLQVYASDTDGGDPILSATLYTMVEAPAGTYTAAVLAADSTASIASAAAPARWGQRGYAVWKSTEGGVSGSQPCTFTAAPRAG